MVGEFRKSVWLVAACLIVSGCTVHITSPTVTADTDVHVQKTPKPGFDPGPVPVPPVKPIGKPGKPMPHPKPIHSVIPIAPPSYAAMTAIVKGHVHDQNGTRIAQGVRVTVRSLNPSYPFESVVDVVGGAYVVNQVPAGVQLEISAGGAGYTEVTRVETLLPMGHEHAGNTINFGGAETAADPAAPEFPLYWLEADVDVPAEGAFGVRGTIYGDAYDYLPNAKVTIKSLHPEYPYEATTEAVDGVYSFNDVPPGVPVEITVSASGYASQSRIEVVQPEHENTGDGAKNVFDFGGPDSPEFAMMPLHRTLSTFVKGTVCDESGEGLKNASVQVLSLNPEFPFTSTVDVVNGHYVVNEVPAGIQLEITAVQEGFQPSSRVVTLTPLESFEDQNVVNFGCGASNEDQAGDEFELRK